MWNDDQGSLTLRTKTLLQGSLAASSQRQACTTPTLPKSATFDANWSTTQQHEIAEHKEANTHTCIVKVDPL